MLTLKTFLPEKALIDWRLSRAFSLTLVLDFLMPGIHLRSWVVRGSVAHTGNFADLVRIRK